MNKESINQAKQSEGILLFRCKQCGALDESLGGLHGHIESHRGFYGIQLPWNVGDFDALMEDTELVVVTDCEVIDPGPEEVKNLV